MRRGNFARRTVGRRVLLGLSLALLLGLVIPVAPPPQAAVGERAIAELTNADGKLVGLAFFEQLTESTVRVTVQVEGLSPGPHGVHIHETGRCEPPDFASAGGHFNPTDAEHGLQSPNGPHAGDLPNLQVQDDGTGLLEVEVDRISLTEGPRSILAGDGTAVVVHAGEDDQRSQPSGASGARVACGVVEGADQASEEADGAGEGEERSAQQPDEGEADEAEQPSDATTTDEGADDSNTRGGFGAVEILLLSLAAAAAWLLIRILRI